MAGQGDRLRRGAARLARRLPRFLGAQCSTWRISSRPSAGGNLGNKFLSRPLWQGGEQTDPFAAAAPVPAAGNEDQKLPQVQRFAEELRKLGAARPLVLAFDHLDKLRTCWKYLQGPLFEAATRGSRPGGLGAGVRFILTETIGEIDDFGLAGLAAQKIELSDLPAKSFEHHVTQYCLYRLPNDAAYEENLKDSRALIQMIAKTRNAPARI